DAFSEIVRRYQTLLCSIADGVTGNLHISEEVAQDAFVAAWKSLPDLKDPDRAKQWLCGIVRNLARNRLRTLQKDVLRKAAVIDTAASQVGLDANPADVSVTREESELVDRALETLPEAYREPLVLYYRHEQSVADVADLLELSPDAVKQRLARGRRMLQEEVAAIVETALKKSVPGTAFTFGVIAALPVMSGTAKAASLTVSAAKGAGAVKAAGWSATAGMILGPLAGILGAWFGYSAGVSYSRSEKERQFVRRLGRGTVAVALVFAGLMTLLTSGSAGLAQRNPRLLAASVIALTVLYTAGLVAAIWFVNRRIAQIRLEDGTSDMIPDDVAQRMPGALRETQQALSYDSPGKLLGLPLVSVRLSGGLGFGDPACSRTKAAFGWIAIGDRAVGILFASGGLAIGGIAFGAASVGILSFAGLAIGGLALGGGTVGLWAMGGFAAGYKAFGGLAVAWKSAIGGMAVAHEFAMGGMAIGRHANDEFAKAWMTNSSFFQFGQWMLTPWSWWIAVAVLLLPMLGIMKYARRAAQQATE
ncbi:MAG: sigma-70 family RNA polymerase sigma factor, partial [Planctomycetaceae bacterium]|nr:sigma-70 family RNA polymerase sigma factor [Planctomycetaceae bacterium]